MIVLGSGATVGAGFTIQYNNQSYEPPMDRNFFTSDIVKKLFSQDAFPALSWYQKSPSLEETISIIDLYAKLCRGGIISEEEAFQQRKELMNGCAQNDESYKRKMERESCLWRLPSMAGWEFLKLVTEILGNLPPENPPESPLARILGNIHEHHNLKGVITFNYDLSLERVWPQSFAFVYPYPGNMDMKKNKVPLYKLHGSLNWEETQNEVKKPSEENMSVVQMEYNNRDNWIQPSLIGPTLFKQEITIDLQKDARAMFYKNLWRMCWESLREVDALIFIGFSFPKTDFHVRVLFESAHQIHPFKKIVICTKNDFTAHATVKDIFTDAKMICFTDGLEEMAERSGELRRFLNA